MSDVESSLELPGGAHALFTTRAHGNLSSVSGDDAQDGLRRRERLRDSIEQQHLARGRQVHGTNVQRIAAEAHSVLAVEAEVEADGQATTVPGVGTLVLTADCLPVALGSNGAVAIIHAGWRGLAAGVLEEGVKTVRELAAAATASGADEEMVAIIGPGAGPCCYEVGEEVHAAFAGAHRHGRRIDLKAIARDRLIAAGVTEVRDLSACTICDERYFSYRREGARSGRQGGVAWLG